MLVSGWSFPPSSRTHPFFPAIGYLHRLFCAPNVRSFKLLRLLPCGTSRRELFRIPHGISPHPQPHGYVLPPHLSPIPRQSPRRGSRCPNAVATMLHPSASTSPKPA